MAKTPINTLWKRKACFSGLFFFYLFFPISIFAFDAHCLGADDPPPIILKADLQGLVTSLNHLKDVEGRSVWASTPENSIDLKSIFESIPTKTKLEQFFQLLFLIQKQFDEKELPVVVQLPGIIEVLLQSRVFTDLSFPQKITSVILRKNGNGIPVYQVQFSKGEVRFPINDGKGFATWEQGMCQKAKELVFYPGFSFQVRKARNSKNLVVDHFDKVEIFGEFGTRKIFSIDLSYVNLEKVEFVEGTDQGKVKTRIAQREFQTNKHSSFFKFIGTLIPNTSRQRIDW